MNLATAWVQLVDSSVTPVSWQYYVSQISTYPASPLAYNYWRGKLVKKGWKGVHLFCHDLVLVDENGFQIRVMLYPGSNGVQSGQLLEGIFITVKSVTKVPYGDKHILALNTWTGGDSFQLQHRGQLHLSEYQSQEKPLSNPFTDLICPWTYANFLWSSQSTLKMKPSVICPEYDPTHHNLTNLDQCWHTLARTWPLVVRVLAKSKDRLVIQQDNHRKPWLALTNLLVADNTAYCVVTIWDEALNAFFNIVKEGDILVLASKYKVGRYRPANQKLMYRLAPKVRNQALSPTEIEIKLNYCDLQSVQLVHCAAICPSIPSPLWNFLSSSQLVKGGRAHGQLVDFVGLVLHHGRWEREVCQDQTNTPTGQYWIRVWLLLADHTSADVVAVKLYVDRERWDAVEGAVPGQAVVVTNLLYMQGEQGTFSHLESSNESQIFSGEMAEDSRFGEVDMVLGFRQSLLYDTDRWGLILRDRGGFGGHLHPPSKIQVTLRTTGFVMREMEDVQNYMKNLAYRGCGRVLIRAKLATITVLRVEKTGKLDMESIEGDSNDDKDCSVLCAPAPGIDSFVKSVAGIAEDNLITAIRQHCFMRERQVESNNQGILIREGHVAMVRLILGDCHVMAQAEIPCVEAVKSIVDSSEYVNGIFCLDLFRIRPQGLDEPESDGVEAVLRSVLGPQDDAPGEIEADSDKSSLVTTMDLCAALV